MLTDDLRIRSGPGTNFSVVGYFHSTSENIQYLDENENWVKVRGEGLEGWVAKEFVSIQAKKQQEQSQTTKKISMLPLQQMD